MPFGYPQQRVSLWDALFALYPYRTLVLFRVMVSICAVLMALPADAASCAPDRIDEYAKVKQVFDGDTILLADGRKLRLIGINSPELGKDERPPEPYADQAHRALSSLLKPHSTVGIRYDQERHDQYHRVLAHLYTPESDSIEAWLLENGYAMMIAIPPNVWNLDCYRQAEQRAQKQQKGLWSRSLYQVIEAEKLDADTHGFRIIRGRVKHVGESGKSVWLDLEGGAALRIDRQDLHYFADIKPLELENRQVIVRGWVHHEIDRPVMRLRHSAVLQVLD